MKTRTLATVVLASLLAGLLPLRAADMTRFVAKPGRNSKMRIEGTSNIHDWQAESALVGGTLEVGPGFPTEPGATAAAGKIEAKAEVFIPSSSLFSLEKDGKKYSDAMDNRMHEKLLSSRITFHLTELTLKEAAKSKDAPYVYDAKGDLVVAGVTNQVSMPVNILPMDGKTLRITGTVTVKMTTFKIDPPAPAFGTSLIKTGDDVKVIWDWLLIEKPAAK